MMIRKDPVVTEGVYHVFNKSIARYVIFNNEEEYELMRDLIYYYRFDDLPCSYGYYRQLSSVQLIGYRDALKNFTKEYKLLVDIIAYCLMPTHFHFILKQNVDNGIATFMKSIQNVYAKYFNHKHKRRGPLWCGRYKNVYVEDDVYLMHLTRYIHLNPSTSYLVDKPLMWKYSSFSEYLTQQFDFVAPSIRDNIDFLGPKYAEFVNAYKHDQQEVAWLKKHFWIEP